MQDKLHKDLVERLEPISCYLDLIDDIQNLREDTPSPERLGAVLKHARALFCPYYKPNACLREYAGVLKLNPTSPEVHHYVGKILMNNRLFFQAHLLFDKGLALETPDTDGLEENLHRKFHYDLSGLGLRLLKYRLKLQDYGYRVDELGFRFSKGRGFSLPDFDYNFFDPEIKKTRQLRDKALVFIHWGLGHEKQIDDEPHTANNCPYLEYVAKKFKHE